MINKIKGRIKKYSKGVIILKDKIDFSEKIHIGELIAVSNVYGLTPYTLLLELEKGKIEVFLSIDEFNKKYSDTTDLDWCQLNNGKVFSKKE